MEDLQIAPWLGLVPIYVAIARLRGSTWRTVVLLPTLMLLAVLVEFALPPMLRVDGLRRAAVFGGLGMLVLVAWALQRVQNGHWRNE